MSTMSWLKLFGITYFSSVPTVHSQRLQIFKDASAEDREAVKLTKLATRAVHCLDAFAVVLPLETGVALASTYGMSECVPMAEILFTFLFCSMVLNPAVCKVHDGTGQFYGITIGFVAAAGIDVSSGHSGFGTCLLLTVFEFTGAALAVVFYWIVRREGENAES